MSMVRDVARAQWRKVDGVYRAATASKRALPDFLIIGASKCGTTSLYDDIVEHPSVIEAAVKEIHFFDTRYDKGMDWYRAQFPLEWRTRKGAPLSERIQTGEASPYYMFHPHAPARIRKAIPDVKAIAMLRNPIDRAYSQYQHEFRKGRETLSFEEAIEREPERLRGELDRMIRDESYNSTEYRRHSYLARGIYVDQLQAWLRHFDRKQLLVVRSEDYFAAPDVTLRQVLSFLELPAWDPGHYARKNVGRYSPIDSGLRQRLADYFAPHNARLYEFLGADFGWK
jgi:hypothetical protein